MYYKTKLDAVINIRIEKRILDILKKNEIDISRLVRSHLYERIKSLGIVEKPKKNYFPRITEAVKSAVNPIIPKRARFKKDGKGR